MGFLNPRVRRKKEDEIALCLEVFAPSSSICGIRIITATPSGSLTFASLMWPHNLRHRVPAFIAANLMKFYNNTNLVNNMFVLNRFEIESFDYKDWPKHENYILIWSDYKIVITERTKLLPFTSDVPRGFRLYPLVPFIITLTHDRGSTKLIVDVGRIIEGERSICSFELFLQC
ncbi:hypothetical protein R6Q57_011787 [Mikania cordata]